MQVVVATLYTENQQLMGEDHNAEDTVIARDMNALFVPLCEQLAKCIARHLNNDALFSGTTLIYKNYRQADGTWLREGVRTTENFARYGTVEKLLEIARDEWNVTSAITNAIIHG